MYVELCNEICRRINIKLQTVHNGMPAHPRSPTSRWINKLGYLENDIPDLRYSV